eukprot:Skav221818  [mRNA]  locus=scaffold885:63217:64083:+ [translate_table: standard]
MEALLRRPLVGKYAVVLATMQFANCVAGSGDMTQHQQMLSSLWDEHVRYEFSPDHKSVEKTVGTMVEESYVNHIPTSIGGLGKAMLEDFYGKHFIFSNPEMIFVPVSRTVGHNQLVDEMVVRTNHTKPIPWLLPGISPTGKQLEFPLVAIIRFAESLPGQWRLAHEHIYWDQAGVLAQDQRQFPIVGAEQAKKVLDPGSVPSNDLLRRAGIWNDMHGTSDGTEL